MKKINNYEMAFGDAVKCIYIGCYGNFFAVPHDEVVEEMALLIY